MPSDAVHVAVAVINNDSDQLLLALRPKAKHQGGLWEFPGGKVEEGESVQDALRRELKEELGIDVARCSPLIRVHYEYPDKRVLLDVWRVTAFRGEPYGCEGQAVRWVDRHTLCDYEFPAANKPIIHASMLPEKYLITGSFNSHEELFFRLGAAFNLDIRLVQFRAHWMNSNDYLEQAKNVARFCRSNGVTLMVKGGVSMLSEDWVDGLHLTSEQLGQLYRDGWRYQGLKLLAASCHSEAELVQAGAIGCSFATLSPVESTASHPDAVPLGRNKASFLTDRALMPVYWLGGLSDEDMTNVIDNGAQGVAAISSWW